MKESIQTQKRRQTKSGITRIDSNKLYGYSHSCFTYFFFCNGRKPVILSYFQIKLRLYLRLRSRQGRPDVQGEPLSLFVNHLPIFNSFFFSLDFVRWCFLRQCGACGGKYYPRSSGMCANMGPAPTWDLRQHRICANMGLGQYDNLNPCLRWLKRLCTITWSLVYDYITLVYDNLNFVRDSFKPFLR